MTIKIKEEADYKMIYSLSNFLLDKIDPRYKEVVSNEIEKIIEVLEIKNDLLSSKDQLIKILQINNATLKYLINCK